MKDISLKIMQILSLVVLSSLVSGCAALTPDFYKTVDDIETSAVVSIVVDKEAFDQKDADVEISISIKKKDDK